MIISTLRDDRCAYINEAAERLFGYRLEEVVGRTGVEIGFWKDRGGPGASLGALAEGRAGPGPGGPDPDPGRRDEGRAALGGEGRARRAALPAHVLPRHHRAQEGRADLEAAAGRATPDLRLRPRHDPLQGPREPDLAPQPGGGRLGRPTGRGARGPIGLRDRSRRGRPLPRRRSRGHPLGPAPFRGARAHDHGARGEAPHPDRQGPLSRRGRGDPGGGGVRHRRDRAPTRRDPAGGSLPGERDHGAGQRPAPSSSPGFTPSWASSCPRRTST